ncbi:MAG TPA: glucoamylase family protein [Fervidobacterium nodosum]|nr:glucoamylase family protein [Fervidobacterium nodosum]
MRRTLAFIYLFLAVFTLAVNVWNENLEKEYKSSFLYFLEQANTDEKSSGYGLVRDRYPGNSTIASIASTGFGLSAIAIGVKEGWITKQEGEKRVIGTLNTLLKLDNFYGFFYHFLDINTGKRAWNSEISTIDTAILICGVLTAGKYFGGQAWELAKKLYERINWNKMVNPVKNYFYMAYYPEKGFQGYWDFYAEQLMLYILGAGTPNEKYKIDDTIYYSFKRNYGSYKTEKFIHSWFGSLFTYQYSHAWIDFRNYVDKFGVNWYTNSVLASMANYYFCQDNKEKYKSFTIGWGVTACDTPNGYNGLLGTPPSGNNNTVHQIDGTLAPSGALGSIVFTPKESLWALDNYYKMPQLVGKYGLKDSFNLDLNWFATDYIGIDKGITLLMIANYKDEFIWKIFMSISYINDGLKKLGFSYKS